MNTLNNTVANNEMAEVINTINEKVMEKEQTVKTVFSTIDAWSDLDEEYYHADLRDQFDEDDYKSFLSEHNFTEDEFTFEKWCREYQNARDFDDWRSDMYEMEQDDFWSNASGAFDTTKVGFVINGTLGLWNGVHKVGHAFEDRNIYDTIKACLGDSINEYEVRYDTARKVVLVDAHHHDGTNHFVIKALTKKGCDYVAKHNEYDSDWNDVAEHVANTKGLYSAKGIDLEW